MVESPRPDVHGHPVGDMVVDGIHQPLGRRGRRNHHNHYPENPKQSRKIHLSLSHNQIHRIADEDGDVKSQSHCHCCQNQGKEHQQAVCADVGQHSLYRVPFIVSLRFPLLFSCFLFHRFLLCRLRFHCLPFRHLLSGWLLCRLPRCRMVFCSMLFCHIFFRHQRASSLESWDRQISR